MIFTIIVFFIAIVTAFGVLSYRAWQIKNGQEINIYLPKDPILNISFVKLEKNILVFLKVYIQKAVLIIAKYWFLLVIKIKKFLMEKWPKIHDFFQKKPVDLSVPQKPSFFTKALLESKAKIKHLKQKIHEDHDMDIKE